MKLTAIDVFAGGGGLTVGLKKAGFNVVSAIELDDHAYATYKVNHPEVKALRQDVRTVSGKALLRLTGEKRIDLLAGCPPCQGFTSLTSKYRRNDPRNSLVEEMARLVSELRPKAVMMENVPGLARKGKTLYDNLKKELNQLGYLIEDGVLEVADYGVPQLRRRLVLLAGKGFRIELPRPTHSKKATDMKWKWKSVRDAIGRMKKPMTLLEAKERNLLETSDWHIVRNLSPLNQARIRTVKPGANRNVLPEKLRPECHKGSYNGFPNVYGRMQWDQPSPTITGGCTTFSKGRFGHPEENRTISVREAALLQTFPEDYRFPEPFMDNVCKIIGNALPCAFAEIVSKRCHEEIIISKKK